MRRQSNKNSKLKVLTAAAVVAAMSTGTLTAFASESQTIKILMDDNTVRTFNVADLTGGNSDYFLNLLTGAFNAAKPIVAQTAAGDWYEISEAASIARGVENAAEHNPFDSDSPFWVYGE